MVTMDEARKIAARRLSDISGCTEWTNAYMFFNPRSHDIIGGFDMPVFVMKEDGRIFPCHEYYMKYAGEEVETIKFS